MLNTLRLWNATFENCEQAKQENFSILRSEVTTKKLTNDFSLNLSLVSFESVIEFC